MGQGNMLQHTVPCPNMWNGNQLMIRSGVKYQFKIKRTIDHIYGCSPAPPSVKHTLPLCFLPAFLFPRSAQKQSNWAVGFSLSVILQDQYLCVISAEAGCLRAVVAKTWLGFWCCWGTSMELQWKFMALWRAAMCTVGTSHQCEMGWLV